MDAITRIVGHLRNRPIARIFEQCHEKDNIIALKLLCILDCEMERLNLYAEIQATNPKLLGLLLRFSSYTSFKYYDYIVKKEIGTRLLRCKFCPLIGPYACILSHMTISHNTHVGMKICVYCNRCELEKHFAENTLDHCYQKYIQQIERDDYECNSKVLGIVTKYFAMLKGLSKKFDIYSMRHKAYTGVGYKSVEKLHRNYGDDFPKECMVFKHASRKNAKDLSTSNGIDCEFNRAMNYLYGRHSDSIHSTPRCGQANGMVIIDDQRQNIPMGELQSLVNRCGSQFQMHRPPKIEPMPSIQMPMEAASRTSFDQQQQLTGNQSPESNVLCSTSTQQRDANDGPMDNFQAMPNISSSNIPFGSPLSNGHDNDSLPTNDAFESIIPAANVAAVYNQLPFDAVQFGLFVAQRLTKLPDERSRRKLENSIQAAILDVERESFQY